MTRPVTPDDVYEAVAILKDVLLALLSISGSESSKLRRDVGKLIALEAEAFDATLPDAVLNCFTLTREAGATFDEMERIRKIIIDETPQTQIGTLTTTMCLRFTLSAEARIVSRIIFKSRDDVEAMVKRVNTAFNPAITAASDETDAASVLVLIALHGALVRDLLSKSRPLPYMIDYQMQVRKPTLWLANRLYADASRANEFIDENHIVHPAFAPETGRCLSN